MEHNKELQDNIKRQNMKSIQNIYEEDQYGILIKQNMRNFDIKMAG